MKKQDKTSFVPRAQIAAKVNIIQFSMDSIRAAAILFLLLTGVRASKASTENSPLGHEISQELQAAEEDRFIVPHSSYIIFIIASFAGLSVFTLFCIKSSRKHKPYVAGSSFTASEAHVLDIDIYDGHDMPEIMPLSEEYEITTGKVFGDGDEKLKIVKMISSGGND
jgi:hypothetical protein